MSELSDEIAAAHAAQDGAEARVIEDVAALRALIAELGANAVTPADLAEVRRLKARANAMDPVLEATLADVPPPA